MEGNYYARRKFTLLKNYLEYFGIEPGRMHFSWVSSAEASKFITVVKEVTKSVKALGPAKNLIKNRSKVS
ncbi:hydrogenase iron-sulfur subunit [bacterium]|nr:hydrogenase iron-sulfur subunit [bacterium]